MIALWWAAAALAAEPDPTYERLFGAPSTDGAAATADALPAPVDEGPAVRGQRRQFPRLIPFDSQRP